MVQPDSDGARLQGGSLSPEVVRTHLAKLYKRHGKLTPELIVTDASKETSPIHSYFEWDDSVAGRLWREEQARTLIRSVRVDVRTETSIVSAVAYVRDPHAKSDVQGYVSVESLANDKESAREVLRYECSRASGLLERSRHLAIALGLADDVDEILEDLGALHAKVAV